MEPPTSLAAQITSDESIVGTNLKSVSPVMAEALSYTSLDFLFIDRQHGTPVMETLENIVRAADIQDVPVVVRTPKDDLSLITFLLDMGVRGIMPPMVEDPEFVREVSSHMRYKDGRSQGSYTRAARWGNVPRDRYGEYVNEDLALLPMIETAAGLDAVDELSGMEEVTSLTIGPGDLAHSVGVPRGSDEHYDVIDDIFERAEVNDCPVGLFTPSPEDVERYADRASFRIFGSDVTLASRTLEDVLGEE